MRETSGKIGFHVSRSAPAPASRTTTGCPGFRCSMPAVHTRICTPSTASIRVDDASACAALADGLASIAHMMHTRASHIFMIELRFVGKQSTLVVAGPKEGHDIPVCIGDLEAPQPIVDERQLFHERRTPTAELVEQRLGIQSVDVGVPT